MENVFDKMALAFGHENLFKKRLNQTELIEIISRYPTSQWLDLFAKIDSFLIVERDEIPDVQSFLGGALFPQSTLRRINAITDKKVVCFSMGQINLLRKLAISYGTSAEEESVIPKIDISKILLAAHDFHNDYDELRIKAGDLESFCQFVIRNGYLNDPIRYTNLFFRAYQMYVLGGNKITYRDGKNFSSFFAENVGISIEQAIALSFALMTPLFQNAETVLLQTTIINPKTFFEHLIIDKTTVESIIETSVINLSDAKKEIVKELKKGNLGEIPVGYNLDIFRKTPLIRLNSGKLVCVNLSCFLQKTTQNLIWLPKSQITNLEARDMSILVNDLTNYRGQLFEEYVKKLCKIIEEKKSKITFHYIAPEDTEDNEEIGDSILIQDKEILILEAKSRQFNESFKYTGEWSKDKRFIEELIKKAVNQIEKATKKIMNGGSHLPLTPKDIKRIYPVVLTYEPIPMHAKVQRFVRQKVKEFSLLDDDIYAPLEIMHIRDLEKVIDASDSYSLIDMLHIKYSGDEHMSETNFNNFFSYYISENKIISNGWQREQWDEFSDKLMEPAFQFKKD